MSYSMIDPRENEPLECECIPCKECCGEGVITHWPDHNPVDLSCSACRGTGKDSSDCAVHDDPQHVGFDDGRYDAADHKFTSQFEEVEF